MIPYIGDISKADAEVLARYAAKSNNILEFGVGASTQVISAYKPLGAGFESLDTDGLWIEKTRENLELLELKEPLFTVYNDFKPQTQHPYPEYDFVFNDGADNLRFPFAIAIWPYVKVGGYLAFHDTRRGGDARNLVEVIAHHHNEIRHVRINNRGSNISIITKKEHEPYTNWQEDEKREPWQLGYGLPPQEFLNNPNTYGRSN